MKATTILTLSETDRALFLSKVSTPDEDGCRLWTAGKNKPDGYGTFWLNGKNVPSHRVAYTLFVGPIPDGLEVDHRCLNQLCCTAEHLRPATNKQNGEHRAGGNTGSRSGVRGVFPRPTKRGVRWRAAVRHNGRLHNLGTFDTVEEAEVAAVAGRLALFTHNDRDRASKGVPL